MSFAEIQEFLSHIRMICSVVPVTVEVHDQGLRVAEYYGFSIYVVVEIWSDSYPI